MFKFNYMDVKVEFIYFTLFEFLLESIKSFANKRVKILYY